MATIVESAPGSVFVDYSRGDIAQRAPSHRILRKNRAFASHPEPAQPEAPPAAAPSARPWTFFFCWPDDDGSAPARDSCWSVCAEDEPDAPSSLGMMDDEPDEPDSDDEEEDDEEEGGAKRGRGVEGDEWATRARTDADLNLGDGRGSPTAVHQRPDDAGTAGGDPNSRRGG